MGDSPLVSIIIPCRNEETFIGPCLDSLIVNDYPKDKVEILVIDGMSEDKTREIVSNYSRLYKFVRLLDNPRKTTPSALNRGIGQAGGDVIIRMDAHATYERPYVSKCITALNKYNADNVGGGMITLPREETLIGRAIVTCLCHRFGVGNSYFRIQRSKPIWVDTVFGGCYRKEVFTRIGLFNEKLVRGQDMEFNLRLKRAGGKILLLPDIVTYYYARSDMKAFCLHNWTNGVWAILPFLYSPIMPVSWRHLVPLAFVCGLIGAILLFLAEVFGWWLPMGIVGAYGLANMGASIQVAIHRKDPRFIAVMPIVFSLLHFGYGLGSLWGVIKAIKQLSIRLLGREEVVQAC